MSRGFSPEYVDEFDMAPWCQPNDRLGRLRKEWHNNMPPRRSISARISPRHGSGSPIQSSTRPWARGGGGVQTCSPLISMNSFAKSPSIPPMNSAISPRQGRAELSGSVLLTVYAGDAMVMFPAEETWTKECDAIKSKAGLEEIASKL